MNQSIIYLRLGSGPVISAGHYHIQTRETCIIRRHLECVRELTACERRPDEPESSDTDFCLQEMGPCLLPLTQACTECNNTISLYYITLIWILPIASTHTRARPPSPRTAEPGQRLCGGFSSRLKRDSEAAGCSNPLAFLTMTLIHLVGCFHVWSRCKNIHLSSVCSGLVSWKPDSTLTYLKWVLHSKKDWTYPFKWCIHGGYKWQHRESINTLAALWVWT